LTTNKNFAQIVPSSDYREKSLYVLSTQ